MLNLHSSLYPITTISILRNTIADDRDLDPFAEADEDTGETKQTQNYIHIRIQRKSPSTLVTLAKGASRITSHRNLT